MPCPVCGVSFVSRFCLSLHTRMHFSFQTGSGSRESDATCRRCGKTFKNHNNLGKHEKLHVLTSKGRYTSKSGIEDTNDCRSAERKYQTGTAELNMMERQSHAKRKQEKLSKRKHPMGSKNVSKRSKDIGDETGSGSEKEMKTSPTETSFEDNPGFRNSVQPIGHQIQPDSFNGGIEANKLIGKDDIVVVKESPTAILDSNENLIEASSGHGSNMLYNLKKISSNSSETVEMPPSTISRLFQKYSSKMKLAVKHLEKTNRNIETLHSQVTKGMKILCKRVSKLEGKLEQLLVNNVKLEVSSSVSLTSIDSDLEFGDSDDNSNGPESFEIEDTMENKRNTSSLPSGKQSVRSNELSSFHSFNRDISSYVKLPPRKEKPFDISDIIDTVPPDKQHKVSRALKNAKERHLLALELVDILFTFHEQAACSYNQRNPKQLDPARLLIIKKCCFGKFPSVNKATQENDWLFIMKKIKNKLRFRKFCVKTNRGNIIEKEKPVSKRSQDRVSNASDGTNKSERKGLLNCSERSHPKSAQEISLPEAVEHNNWNCQNPDMKNDVVYVDMYHHRESVVKSDRNIGPVPLRSSFNHTLVETTPYHESSHDDQAGTHSNENSYRSKPITSKPSVTHRPLRPLLPKPNPNHIAASFRNCDTAEPSFSRSYVVESAAPQAFIHTQNDSISRYDYYNLNPLQESEVTPTSVSPNALLPQSAFYDVSSDGSNLPADKPLLAPDGSGFGLSGGHPEYEYSQVGFGPGGFMHDGFEDESPKMSVTPVSVNFPAARLRMRAPQQYDKICLRSMPMPRHKEMTFEQVISRLSADQRKTVIEYMNCTTERHILALELVDVFFTLEEQISSSYVGPSARQLNPEKLNMLRTIVFYAFPLPDRKDQRKEWKMIMKKIKSKIRCRKFRLKKRNSKGQSQTQDEQSSANNSNDCMMHQHDNFNDSEDHMPRDSFSRQESPLRSLVTMCSPVSKENNQQISAEQANAICSTISVQNSQDISVGDPITSEDYQQYQEKDGEADGNGSAASSDNDKSAILHFHTEDLVRSSVPVPVDERKPSLRSHKTSDKMSFAELCLDNEPEMNLHMVLSSLSADRQEEFMDVIDNSTERHLLALDLLDFFFTNEEQAACCYQPPNLVELDPVRLQAIQVSCFNAFPEDDRFKEAEYWDVIMKKIKSKIRCRKFALKSRKK